MSVHHGQVKDKILTRKEVASLLRVDPSTVTRFAMSGELRSYLVGARRLFRESDVWEFFDNREARVCAE